MPAAFLFSILGDGAPVMAFQIAVVSSVFVSISIVAYSWVQVRAGRWSHVDASVPGERRQINLFLMLLFFCFAGLMLALGQPQSHVIGPAFSGALVAFGHLLRPWFKVSLHASFAMFGASLLWPSLVGTLAVLVLALGVAWSRLVLSRHTPHEVVIGVLAGAATGVVFKLVQEG